MSIAPYKFVEELPQHQLTQVMELLKKSDSAYFGQDVTQLLTTFSLTEGRDMIFSREIMDKGELAAYFFADHWFGRWAREEIPY